MEDDELIAHVVDRLTGINDVVAVALGGSRAQGTERPDSDWDFGVYYRGHLDTDAIRRIGWDGQVFEPGDWGGGVFNGGAWLSIDGRKVDLIYRDVADVARRCDEAERGEFQRQLLMFYLAGVPTYIVVGELAVGRLLHGALPTPPTYPDPLSVAAEERWHAMARDTLSFGEAAHANRGDAVGGAGVLAQAILMEAHSRLAARKEWVVNEKGLAAKAGLDGLFPVGATSDGLTAAYAAARQALD